MSTDSYKLIYDSAIKFFVPLDLEQTYMAVVKEAVELVDGADGSIFIFSNNKASRVYTTNNKLYDIVPRRDGITYEVYNTRLPRLRHKKGLVEANNGFRELAYGADMSVPLNFGHITIGVLSVLTHYSRKLDVKNLNLLALFSPLATLALHNAQLRHAAKKSIESKDLLISLASHELKNPLTSIKLNAQLLERSPKLRKLPEHKRIDALLKGISVLDSMTHELLQVKSNNNGKLAYNMGNVDVIALTKHTVDESRQRHKTHQIVFNTKGEKKVVYVNGDQDKLAQAFVNILNNAVKFSKKKTQVTVDVIPSASEVSISFSDQGVGIDKNVIPNLFKRYYRGQSKKDGMGLGLYLVKKIISKHGGKIKLKSELNKGTNIIITLPVHKIGNSGKRDRQ